MDQLFIVLLSYLKPLAQVDQYLPAHNEFLRKHYASGHFIVSGPQVPRTGGLIMLRAQSRSEAESIMAADPFVENKVASFSLVQFRAADFSYDFAEVMK